MMIKFKKLHDKAVNPYKKHVNDLGWDLTAISTNIVNAPDHGYIEYDTGWAVEIPVGFGGFIFPRSSISNTGLILSNAVGVIDPDYRGSIKARFKYIKNTKQYEIGERCCQLIILSVPNIEIEIVKELSSTERQENGFGSTGQKIGEIA